MVDRVIVTGANRGIGLAIARGLAARGLDVIIGSRNLERGQLAAQRLEGDGLRVRVEQLDVASDDSVMRCAERVGPVDVLVNNAGIYLPDDVMDPSELPDALLEEVLQTNLYGALRTMRAWLPAMVRQQRGRVVNVSSIAGRLSAMPSDCHAGYVLSKSALIALTRLAAVSSPPSVKINCMCPGFVQSDMGYAVGDPPHSLEEGADTAVWLATLPDDGPTGTMFIEREPVPW